MPQSKGWEVKNVKLILTTDIFMHLPPVVVVYIRFHKGEKREKNVNLIFIGIAHTIKNLHAIRLMFV